MSGKSTGTRIGTHDKTFRCSQVLACALLKLLPQYEDASIVRSQDQNILDTCDIVVDVGGVYDHSRHRYDHRMRYSSPCTDLTARIFRLNPWSDSRDEEKDQQFEKAVALAREIFLEYVQDVKNVRLPSMDIVRHAMESRFEVVSSGEIITLSESLPYEEYLFEVEKEMHVSVSIKYVIWKDGNIYSISCVQESCVHRQLFPKAWGGLSNDTLEKACKIKGALFVSPDRDFGSHKTKDGAITMARKALELDKKIEVISRYKSIFYFSEILACALLQLLPAYKNAQVMQSLLRTDLFGCKRVGDSFVSCGTYVSHNMMAMSEPSTSTVALFKNPRREIKLKNRAGRTYHNYGHEILRNVFPDIKTEDTLINEIHKFVNEKLITKIDSMRGHGTTIETAHEDQNSNVFVARMIKIILSCRDKDEDEWFWKAVPLAQKVFVEIVRDVKNVHLPLILSMRSSMESRFEVDSSGEIIILSASVLCEDHKLFYVEWDMKVPKSIKYIILGPIGPRNRYHWQIACILWRSYRMLLPEAWGGLENNALEEACGIEGALYVFSERCRGGHKTKDGAVAMARKALEIEKPLQKITHPPVLSRMI
ncbi:uncharacterized protein [Temnothorax nylanderi]|uniref:uncharacterized protein isoform X2 n=1 Tax=Temnothorax nylanderi TaxID=102681 RepID=UPI003A8ABC97